LPSCRSTTGRACTSAANLGWGGGHARDTLFEPNLGAASNSFGSIYGGVELGYNFLLPSRVVLGVEADISFPNFLETDDVASTRKTGQSVISERVDFVSTVRGRLGYAFDRWMIYGTGGLALSQARLTESPGAVSDEDNLRRLRSGWSLGGGAEIAIAPEWNARAEYTYDRFGGVSGAFASGTRFDPAVDEHMVRFGLNRRLDLSDAATGKISRPTNNRLRLQVLTRSRSPPPSP
jgi:high affinity Mn2+ porin